VADPGVVRRLLRAAAAWLAAAAVAVGVWYAAAATPRAAAPPPPPVSTTTAPVTRADVVQRLTLTGTLGYDGAYSVLNQLPAGVVTSVPAPGTVIRRGGQLFAVAGAAAVLLYGTVPAYRDFAAGMTDGADVAELERNLVALGMDPGRTVRVDGRFSTATAAAVRRWQAARGLPAAGRTGRLRLGQVAFLPGPLRVTRAGPGVGALAGPGTSMLSGTSTTRVVTVPVGTDQQQLVRLRDRVEVTPPAGGPVAGTVVRIGRIADTPPATGSGPSTPTVPVTVALRLPAAAGDLDQAPVQVSITVAAHRGVLTVPVTALLAATGGGYQVRLVGPAGPRLLDVQPGLYDDSAGAVEVAGAGLRAGMTVEVPVS
jgi:peptidoglycan hydrolase-like protein with peptidoglycan-binding domain